MKNEHSLLFSAAKEALDYNNVHLHSLRTLNNESSMTPNEARTALHQALHGRADHAAFVSLSSRQIGNGVRLCWFDYLSREEGSLLVVHESQLLQTVETLLSELQNWRSAAGKLA